MEAFDKHVGKLVQACRACTPHTRLQQGELVGLVGMVRGVMVMEEMEEEIQLHCTNIRNTVLKKGNMLVIAVLANIDLIDSVNFAEMHHVKCKGAQRSSVAFHVNVCVVGAQPSVTYAGAAG